MSDYDPFGKPFREIAAADLSVLRTVTEGWYIEYKGEVPNADSIAKSVSAFANTYGGWLFYGIEEKSRGECVAGDFPGIAIDELDGLLHRIRQAVAVSVNPAPHFDLTVLAGPDEGLGLVESRAVIAIHVPRGHNAPFVHRSGRIYRRVGDGSEPRPENDRFVLDQLWQRGKLIEKEYADWLNHDLELSKVETERGYLRLFVLPDLWRDQDIWAELSTARLREIMRATGEVEETFSFSPFDTVHRTASGYVCRQLAGNDPANLSATWLLKPNLVSEVIFPLPVFSAEEQSQVAVELDGYEHGQRYAEVLERMGHTRPKVVDLNFIFASLIGVMHIYSLLGREAGFSGPLFIKAELIGLWRTSPFLDAPSVIAHQAEHGVPMCLKEQQFVPPGTQPDTFVEIPELLQFERADERKLWRAILAFDAIAHAFGIETGSETAGKPDKESTMIHQELFSAATRAMTAQDRRNERLRRSGD